MVDYQHPYVVNPMTEGKWIRASTIKVEQRQGVHHLLTGYMTEVPKDGKAYENKWGVSVGGYAVGAESEVCLLYTSPSPRDGLLSRMPSSA